MKDEVMQNVVSDTVKCHDEEAVPAALFEDPAAKRFHVVWDGIEVIKDYKDIFDTEKYDSIKAVTYVASPSVLGKFISKFSYSDIVIGIDKVKPLEKVKALIDSLKYGVSAFNGSTAATRDKLLSGVARVRYCSAGGVPVHDKFYLLKNSVTGEFLTVTGSLNLTRNALYESTAQYETCYVHTGKDYYESLLNRFRVLSDLSNDCIPAECYEKWMQEREVLNVADVEELKKIMESNLLNNKRFSLQVAKALTPDDLEELNRQNDFGDPSLSQEDRDIIVFHNQITREKDGQILLQTPLKIKKAISTVPLTVLQKETEYLPPPSEQFGLIRHEVNLDLYEGVPATELRGAFYHKPYKNENILSPEEVKTCLENIHDFIATYGKYILNPCAADEMTEYQKLPYEAILYTMTGPSLCDFRKEMHDAGNDQGLRYVSMYLILGGKKETGKSNLLAYLFKLIQGKNAELSQIQYSFLKTKDQYGSKLRKALRTGNRSPLFVEEIQNELFRDTALIKDNTNSLPGKEYGPIVGTTNSERYNPEEGNDSRIKYLCMNKAFHKHVGNQEYQAILSRANNMLTKDLNRQLYERRNEFLEGRYEEDPLWLTRKIFLEYYAYAGLPVPKYFPQDWTTNIGIEARNSWKDIYNRNPEIFVPLKGDANKVQVKISDIDANAANTKADREQRIKNIPSRVFDTERSKDVFITFYTNQFFDWIGEPIPNYGLKAKAKGLLRNLLS